ncbi:MAG: hypothetical protein ABI193_10830, partial [Minicystis sp.]
LLLASAFLCVGCSDGTDGGDEAAAPLGATQAAVSSDLGTLLTFSFDGEVLVHPDGPSIEESIAQQLHYTIGQLNGAGGVSSPATARVSNIQRSGAHTHGHGRDHGAQAAPEEIHYHAELPVAWPSQDNLPSSYPLILPLRVDADGESLLQQTSSSACFDSLSESGLWYDYRPGNPGCTMIVPLARPLATVTPAPLRSAGRYPEQDRIWEDGTLSVLAIFRKDAPGSTSSADLGRVAFAGFVQSLLETLGPETKVLLNAGVGHKPGAAPGFEATDITLSRAYPHGRTVNVIVLLEDVVALPEGTTFLGNYSRFLQRYAALSPTADLILYNGHSGLGDNIRSIADNSSFLPGKYQMMYLDACDSFAYMSDDLGLSRGAQTADDPTGTRNLDVIVNGMPATFAGMPAAAMAIVEALLPDAEPRTYEAILAGFDPARVGFVLGDEDNVYRPSPSPGLSAAPVFALRGAADHRSPQIAQTPLLPPGDYAFELGPNWAAGGKSDALTLDARALGSPDLAVRCERSSSELGARSARCTLRLDSAANVELTVTGDHHTAFALTGFALTATLDPTLRAKAQIDALQPGSRQRMK